MIWILILVGAALWLFSPINRYEDFEDDWTAISQRRYMNSPEFKNTSNSPMFWPMGYPSPQDQLDFMRDMYKREERMMNNNLRTNIVMIVLVSVLVGVVYFLAKFGVL